MQAERVAGAGMAWQPGQAGAILGRRLRARRALATAGWLVGWLAVGAGLRGWSSGRFPLREDEALYAFWARLISSGLDPMLERVAVDKPPFFLYALAQFFTWFGPSEASGRLLSQIASFLSIFLVGALAWRMYGRRTAMVALPLAALSPFAISFAPTLYTDPTLTAWLLLALLAASLRRGRGLGWRLASGLLAGLALGMAFDTKQNALLFVPLVLGAHPRRSRPGRLRLALSRRPAQGYVFPQYVGKQALDADHEPSVRFHSYRYGDVLQVFSPRNPGRRPLARPSLRVGA